MLKEGLAEEATGVLVELHRAIPIPMNDVPFDEVLEFKHRRYDQLLLLRYLLESFVSKIEASADNTQAREKCIAELDQACADLLAVGKE